MNGTGPAEKTFDWNAGLEFFESFGNSEVIDAELRIGATLTRSPGYTGVSCEVSGSVTVECDRCLDPLALPVETSFRLSVKFGPEPGRTETDDGEIVMLPYGDAFLDLSQFIYDYVCTSLPLQRVHPDGECNEETLKYLSK